MSPAIPSLVVEHASLVLDGNPILAGVDLRFGAGSLAALVGPNGAGKSSLLLLLAGDRAPTTGRVLLDGHPVRDWKVRELARRRAVMPQDHGVRFGFSVREVVAMGRLPHPADRDADARVVEEALATADMQAFAGRNVQTLSGGEAARTAFARVLAQATPLVLLDEPTAALDLHHQVRVLRKARALADDGACVIVVLHDLNLAAAHADRIVVLDAGRVAADGNPREVLTPELIGRVYRQPVQVIEHPTRAIPLVVLLD